MSEAPPQPDDAPWAVEIATELRRALHDSRLLANRLERIAKLILARVQD